MAAQLLRQGSPIIHSIRALLPRHKVISAPPTLLASSTLNSPLHPHQLSSQSPQSAHPPDHKQFSTSSTTMASTKPFFAAVESRRTIYPLKNESPISDERIKEIVTMAVKHAPSAFNSQTGRVVVVLKKEHVKLWEAIMQVYKAMLPEDKYNGAKERFDMFKGAYGTVLFYEDTTNVREFQEKFKAYEDKFPQWSEQSNGMMQYIVWTALAAEGMGVNLQHYNPPIDKRLETEFNVPETWSLKAQMVFGTPLAPPKEKEQKPIDARMKVFE